MITILNGKAGFIGTLALVLCLALFAGSAPAAEDGPSPSKTADILGVDLGNGPDASTTVLIHARGAVSHRETQLTAPDRFVVDLPGTILRGDTTPIEGDGVLVGQVRVAQFSLDPVPVTRVVIDLVKPAICRVEESGNGLRVVMKALAAGSRVDPPSERFSNGLEDALPLDQWQAQTDEPRVAQPVRRETDASYARMFSVNVQNADIQTILRSIAEFSGKNIIASPEVVGNVTASLTNVPWREALDVILRAHGFGYVEEHGVIRVDTLKKLRDEEIAQKTARQRVEQIEKLSTRVVRIDFANAEEVRSAMKNMMSPRGSVEVEPRTNSLVVTDIPSVLDMVTEMARKLDSRTPQVHIDALLLDIDTRIGRELGIQWGVNDFKGSGSNISGDLSVDAGVENPIGQFRIGGVQDWGTLQLTLQALEKENKAQIISNPSITTTDNREAEILVGQKIPLIVADEAGNSVTQLTTIGIRLIVTPHINSDRQITLDIHPEVSDLSSEATVQGGVIINTSEADTRVLVNNGDTAVIAGLIRDVESTLHSGVPILKDIPLLGNLFKSTSQSKAKRELIVFITPTILGDLNQMMDQRQEDLFKELQDRKTDQEIHGLGL